MRQEIAKAYSDRIDNDWDMIEYSESQGWLRVPTITRRPKKGGDGYFDAKEYGRKDTNGFVTIAFANPMKATWFAYVVKAKNDRRTSLKKKPMSTHQVQVMWKEFCFIWNSAVYFTLNEENKDDQTKEFEKKMKNWGSYSATQLARLGHEDFTYDDVKFAWEYDVFDKEEGITK